jgi:DNA polymerase beta
LISGKSDSFCSHFYFRQCEISDHSGLTKKKTNWIHDLSLAPLKSRGAAQIVLTGDEEFARIARLAAARHGMYLDEYGLWRWHSSEEASFEYQSDDNADADAADADTDAAEAAERRRPNGYWELVEGENEEKILDELELGSIPPHRRNFRFLTSKPRASARAGTLDFSLAAADVRQERNGNGGRWDEDG